MTVGHGSIRSLLATACLGVAFAPLGEAQETINTPVKRFGAGRLANVSISPDGMTTITAARDRIARTWSVETGEMLQEFLDHKISVGSVAYSPDGTLVASSVGYRNGSFQATIWSVSNGQLLHEFEGHSRFITEVTFTPDGSRIPTASNDDTARVWSVTTGQLITTLSGHPSDVNSVASSPFGDVLLTGSTDGTAILWNTEWGENIRTLSGHRASVEVVAFSPDASSVPNQAQNRVPSSVPVLLSIPVNSRLEWFK